MISVKAALDQAEARLEAAGIESARLDAKYLMAEVLEQEAVGLSLYGEEKLATDQIIAFNDLIDRRADREPVAKILERRAFYGLDFVVSTGTLDPRADSEALIDLALTLPPPGTILDLGTGTGCLLLSLLKQLPNASGVGLDLSREALSVARENSEALDLTERAAFAQGSWTEPLSDEAVFDLIISNPPYIRDDEYDDLQPEVREWDPPVALFAGADGLAAYRAILGCIGPHAHAKTHLIFEIGIGQGPDVIALAEAAGWHHIETRSDLGGIDRALAFSRAGD